MESKYEDNPYANPCYTMRSVPMSQQGCDDNKSEAVYENLDTMESTHQSTTLKPDEPTTPKNGKSFPCAVLCAIALLILISAAALALSIWNTFKLQSSTIEGASNLMQQNQQTQIQLEEVRNVFSTLENTVQNLSNNQLSTAGEVSNLNYLMQQSQLTQNQLEEVKNDSALLQEAVHNIINNVSIDLEKITSTLTAYQYKVSNNFSTALQSFNDSINFDLGAIQTTIQQIISTLSLLICGPGTWRRLVYLNMNDPSQRCPPAWREYTTPVRSCGRPATNTVCAPSVFSTQGTRYSRVCGRIIGYQYGRPEAFNIHSNSITDHLADGISVVYGNPETHIWTFAAGNSDSTTNDNACPCANPRAQASPLFVGNNYFCESGTTQPPSGTFYSNDPLWDGEGCVNSQCECTFNSPPWFNVQLPSSTTDDIEVRICGYTDTNDEDTPVELIEIYVQ